jgi:site-specific DNA-methyltransferase (adenine-specific)
VLHLGDCLDVMGGIADGSVDLILADLPYGTTACKWDTVIPFAPLWAHYKRVLKANGVVALCASQPFTAVLTVSNLPWWRHEWVQVKNAGSNFANTVREPMKEHETVQVFSPGRWTYNKQMQPRTGGGAERVKYPVRYYGDSEVYRKMDPRIMEKPTELRVPSSVQKFNRDRGLHSTQKPVKWMEYLIRTYTNAGELVLDNTMGSGTTGVACVNTGRRFIGIEKDPEIFATAKARIEAVQPQLIPA